MDWSCPTMLAPALSKSRMQTSVFPVCYLYPLLVDVWDITYYDVADTCGTSGNLRVLSSLCCKRMWNLISCLTCDYILNKSTPRWQNTTLPTYQHFGRSKCILTVKHLLGFLVIMIVVASCLTRSLLSKRQKQQLIHRGPTPSCWHQLTRLSDRRRSFCSQHQ